MSPNAGDLYAGKRIARSGEVLPYPKATWWNWATVQIPATVIALYDYLKAAQRRNAYLIRGIARCELTSPARRLKENFLDTATPLLFFDIDGHPGEWQADPEAAVHRIVTQLGEPWASASYTWFFSGTHGLKIETEKTGKLDEHGKEISKPYWRGELSTARSRSGWRLSSTGEVAEREAVAITKLLSISSGVKLDPVLPIRPSQTTPPASDGSHIPTADVLGDTVCGSAGSKALTNLSAIPEVTAT